MPLTILPILATDLPSIPPILFAGFASSTIHPLMYPNGTTPQALAAALHSFTTAFSNPKVTLLKVVDTSASDPITPIAFAKWHFDPAPDAPTSSSAPPEDPGPEDPTSNAKLMARFFGGLDAACKKVVGERPHAKLGILVTLPEHQGRGAGSMLVRCGCEKADAMGLECYLEASDMGLPIYENAGFRTVDEFVMDLREWGGSGLDSRWIMRRGINGGEFKDG